MGIIGNDSRLSLISVLGYHGDNLERETHKRIAKNRQRYNAVIEDMQGNN